ncbi:1-phosphofructokinase family hexose kinase [Catellatospora bangladeshensis]|uniref:1-phosphofructokinase n=1 Tax=Catellatospora bangladeshensis TaxID=310355 RepID=A0A8J3JLV4_9ACTN|nr:PfkB family carbohydrate kinase [Catellatospora bangladeshensis]GIF80314.1 1-phosphofructokinase [Catellatospora bangladeshensis]
MPESVMVFAPSPQLTVTVEQVGDDEQEIHLHAGGQGVWVARMIKSLGVRAVLCSAFGDETGRVVRNLILDEGLELGAVDVSARNGAYVHDRRDGQRREVAEAPGRPLSRHEQDELYNVALAEGLRAKVAVLTGVADPQILPPDVFRRLAGDLRRNGTTVVADLSGDYLTAVLEGGVDVLKVSHEELLRDGMAPDDSIPSLVSGLFKLREDGAANVILSRAEHPAFVLIDGEVNQVELPRLEPADHRGAGDSMTAGVAATLARGGDLAEAVRTGAAAGALNVTRHGLGTGRADVIAQFTTRVELTPVPGGGAVPPPEPDRSGHMSPEQLAEKVTHA